MDSSEELLTRLASEDEELRRVTVRELATRPFALVRHHLYAALGDDSWRVRKEAVEAILKALPAGEAIAELVDLLRIEGNPGLRNSAVEVLQLLGERSVPHLCRVLNDNDVGVRKFAIDTLGAVGSPSAVPFLIASLDDSDPNVAAAAAESLGSIGDGRAVLPLVQSLGAGDLLFKHSVLDALTRLGQPVPLDTLAVLVSQPLLAKSIFDCLRVVGTAEAVPLVMPGLRDRRRNVREAAVATMAAIYRRAGADGTDGEIAARLHALVGSEVVGSLVNALASTEREVREGAICLLGAIGDGRAVEGLLSACRDELQQALCLQAFARLGDAARQALPERFAGAGDEERCLIAQICGELHFPAAAEIVTQALSDDYPPLRAVAAGVVARARLAEFVPRVASLLTDEVAAVRRAAGEALRQLAIESRPAVAAVANELASAPLPQHRLESIQLLAALAENERLLLLGKDPDAAVRRAAVAALGEVQPAGVRSALVLALADEKAEVRIAAAIALGQCPGAEVTQALLLALNDVDPWVQCAALRSLQTLDDPAVVPRLYPLLTSVSGIVVITAMKAIQALDREGSASGLVGMLHHHDEEVAKAAVDLLAGTAAQWLDEFGIYLLKHPLREVRRKIAMLMAEQWGARAVPVLAQAAESEPDELLRGFFQELKARLG
jgi:HEAT repeat protein